MSSHGVGTSTSPIFIDDDSDTEVEAQVLPVPHPQPQPQLELSTSGTNTRPRGPTTPRAPRAMQEQRKGRQISSDTVGFQMLMRMGYEPGKGLGLELEGPSEPLAPEHRPVFNKLGLGGVPTQGAKNKPSPVLTPAPEPEQGVSTAKTLTKKQRKLAAQAERIAQIRSQSQAGPSKPIPRAPRAMSKPPPTGPKAEQTHVPNQEPMQIEDDDSAYFIHQPAGFFPNPQAAMQMQMAAQMGMGLPFFPPMFDPMLGFPMDAAFMAAHQGMAFNPEFFPNQFGAPIPPSPVLPTEPRASRKRSGSTQKPTSSSAKVASSSKSGNEPTSTSAPDKVGEQYTIRGITYRPALGPIGVQAVPDTDYSSRNGGIPGSFAYYPELSFTTDPNRTIVLETMPRKLRTLAFIENWAAQFAVPGPEGEPPAHTSQVLLRDTKALVEFTTVAGAARAFASPRMNGNGGQPGIRAYAYVQSGQRPRDPQFVQLAMASPQWHDVVTPRDIIKRDNEILVRPGKLFGPEDEDVSRQLAAMRDKGKGKEVQPQPAPVDDDLEEGEVVETPKVPPIALAQPHASSSKSTTTPTAPREKIRRPAHKKLDNRPVGGETTSSTSGASLDPPPLSTVSDSAAYEAALRSRIKTRALKRTRDEAFGLQPPSPSDSSSTQPPLLAPVAQAPIESHAASSSTASSSRSTSTPALTPTSATFSASNVPSTPSTSATEPASTALPSSLITFDAEAFLMDTLRDAKRQRVYPEEPREAFAFHCARRDTLLAEFNAVMVKEAAATDAETKRALSAHMREIVADLELTRRAVNATKALVDALNAAAAATPTPAPPSPVAHRRVSPPTRISMSPQPTYDLDDIVEDILPTLTPGCKFPNPVDDSPFVFIWEDEDKDDIVEA